MDTRIVRVLANAAIVVYTDKGGVRRAVTVPRGDLPSDVSNGEEVKLTKKLLSTCPEYGLDWGVILDGDAMEITPGDIQNVFYDYGVYTAEDVSKNTEAFHAAIQQFVRKISVDITRKVSRALGE